MRPSGRFWTIPGVPDIYAAPSRSSHPRQPRATAARSLPSRARGTPRWLQLASRSTVLGGRDCSGRPGRRPDLTRRPRSGAAGRRRADIQDARNRAEPARGGRTAATSQKGYKSRVSILLWPKSKHGAQVAVSAPLAGSDRRQPLQQRRPCDLGDCHLSWRASTPAADLNILQRTLLISTVS